MIEFVSGDLFSTTYECIINPVNTVGVMGGGLALEFKHRYPKMFERYQKLCASGELHVGTVHFWKAVDSSPFICNFPTKDHYRNDSTLDIIKSSLTAFVNGVSQLKIKSAAFPKVGCGLGGLDFNDVKLLLTETLVYQNIDIKVYLG